MSQSSLRRKRSRVRRSFSAPESITFSAMKNTQLESRGKAELKVILETALISKDTLNLIGANKVCTEVALELHDISGLIEREARRENQTFIQQVMNILTAIRNQEVRIWEPFFEAVESMINQQVCAKTFVNFTAFGMAIVRRYKEELPNSPTSWLIDLVAELMDSACERYRIYDWIQGQGGWMGVLRLIRDKYQTVVDYVPLPRRLGSWRQIALGSGVIIGVIAVGAGIWFTR